MEVPEKGEDQDEFAEHDDSKGVTEETPKSQTTSTFGSPFKPKRRLPRSARKWDFALRAPPSDRVRVLNVVHAAHRSAFLEILPLNYDENTLDTIRQIDVLWLKGRSMARAFEVEHTTAIYSGILRMADLLALQPNMQIRLHIVAPDERREKVLREIKRPVFSLLDHGPLYEKCTYRLDKSWGAHREVQPLSRDRTRTRSQGSVCGRQRIRPLADVRKGITRNRGVGVHLSSLTWADDSSNSFQILGGVMHHPNSGTPRGGILGSLTTPSRTAASDLSIHRQVARRHRGRPPRRDLGVAVSALHRRSYSRPSPSDRGPHSAPAVAVSAYARLATDGASARRHSRHARGDDDLTFIDIAIEELKPQYMRGFGTVPDDAVNQLNGVVHELTLSTGTERYVKQDLDKHLEQAAERN